MGLPDVSVPPGVKVADGVSPLVTSPICNCTVFPSLPSSPGFPSEPRGMTRLILYLGCPPSVVPLAMTSADASVPASPVVVVPPSNTGVSPIAFFPVLTPFTTQYPLSLILGAASLATCFFRSPTFIDASVPFRLVFVPNR